jgi:hypothetical protein
VWNLKDAHRLVDTDPALVVEREVDGQWTEAGSEGERELGVGNRNLAAPVTCRDDTLVQVEAHADAEQCAFGRSHGINDGGATRASCLRERPPGKGPYPTTRTRPQSTTRL